MMAMGAKGVISVASNVVPGAVAKLCSLCLEGRFEEATALFTRYQPLFSALFLETNPIPVKAAMKLLGTDSGILRLPLTEIGESNLLLLKNAMQSVGLGL
jgi:4-hydroxy-tetrahydrodipicolinate synthase